MGKKRNRRQWLVLVRRSQPGSCSGRIFVVPIPILWWCNGAYGTP